MKIGIIGTGNVGSTLGRLWVDRGHKVFFGSRTPRKAVSLSETLGDRASGGSIAEAVSFGEIVVIATPWEAVQDMLKDAGSFAGKIVIDCVNAVGPGFSLVVGHETSAAEEIAKWTPGSKVVKAFNSIHYGNLPRPTFGGVHAAMFYCGNDELAKFVVGKLAEEIGLKPVDCGPLSNAHLLESVGILWMQLAYPLGRGTDFAFGLLER